LVRFDDLFTTFDDSNRRLHSSSSSSTDTCPQRLGSVRPAILHTPHPTNVRRNLGEVAYKDEDADQVYRSKL